MLGGIAEGLHLAAQDKRLLGTLVVTVIYNLFAWPFTSMVPVIAQRASRLGPAGTGVLASMDGLGAFCWAPRWRGLVRPRHYGRVYLGGIIIYLAMLTAFALMPSPLPAGGALLLEGSAARATASCRPR